MVMFDLPTITKEEKREYTRFRKYLVGEGFVQLQYSVYAKYLACRENSLKYRRHIEMTIPPGGHVRILMITDKQFGDMISLYGKSIDDIEQKPEQLLLF